MPSQHPRSKLPDIMEQPYEISALLDEAERVMPYEVSQELVQLRFDKDVCVVSDLHVGRGKGSGGCYSGTENFFYDNELARFLDALRRESATARVLVINGDFIDFLRITELPRSAEDFARWQRHLEKVGVRKTIQELRNSITDKERTYGFKTNDYKSVYRLALAAEGHPRLFDALAAWLEEGNDLVLAKGNHDLEWIWPAVRKTLRLLLAERMTNTGRAVNESVIKRLRFVDKALVVDNELYIEHGHRYDKFSQIEPVGEDILPGGEELNLPFGSFFNRYLLNKIELVYPYFDNVRPRAKILPLLIRERLPLAIKVLFAYIPFLIRVIPKRYFFAMYAQVAAFLLLFVAPLAFLGYELYRVIAPAFDSTVAAAKGLETSSAVFSQVMSFAASLGSMVLSYFLARVIAYFQLDEPSTLLPAARTLMKRYPDIKFFTFGHTHNPEQTTNARGQWFFNSGTWIPVIETSSAEVRSDRTFTLLRFQKNAFGQFNPSVLERWNDDAARFEDLVLTTEKQNRRSRRKAKRLASMEAAAA